jgi:hypothetical protein
MTASLKVKGENIHNVQEVMLKDVTILMFDQTDLRASKSARDKDGPCTPGKKMESQGSQVILNV